MGYKVLFIGDIHGVSGWKEIALGGLKNFYKIVFLGDFVDSFHIKPIDQIHNLKEIIKFKKKYPDQLTLLLGNHDFSYINSFSSISGYQYLHAHEYKEIFQENLDLFNIAWGHTNPKTNKYTLCTHAGLTYKFWNQYVIPEFEEELTHKRYGSLPDFSREGFLYRVTGGKKIEDLEIHETLNFLRDSGEIIWKVGDGRGGRGTPGPLWADLSELLDDPYPEINQVFGHTPVPSVFLDHIGDNFYVCVDSYLNKSISSITINL